VSLVTSESIKLTLFVFKTVKSYFKPLTREQFELRTLQSTQEARLQLEARSIANASVVAEVIDLVGDRIIIDGDDVGDVVPAAFEQILEDLDGEVVPVVFAQIIDDITPWTSTIIHAPVKRHRNVSRPDNWREIIQHYMVYKNSMSTIAQYGLLNFHPSYDYWMATFSKWRRDYLNVNYSYGH